MRFQNILFILVHYLSYDDLEKLSKIMYINDRYYEILFNKHFGNTKSTFREIYAKYDNKIKRLSNDQRAILNKIKVNLNNVMGILYSSSLMIYYVTYDYQYYLFEDLRVIEVGFRRDLLNKPDRTLYDLTNYDMSCYKPLPIFDSQNKVYDIIIGEVNKMNAIKFNLIDFIHNHYKDDSYCRGHEKVKLTSNYLSFATFMRYKKFNIYFKLFLINPYHNYNTHVSIIINEDLNESIEYNKYKYRNIYDFK
jgi:hypothetical protein